MNKLQVKKVKLTKADKGKILPNFDSLFGKVPAESTPDPLKDLEYTNNPEIDAQNEISATLAAFIKEKNEKRDQFRVMVDTEYWVAICFQSRAQKEEFLIKVDLFHLGDKYLNGLEVAKIFGVDIQPIQLDKKSTKQAPKLLRKEVRLNP